MHSPDLKRNSKMHDTVLTNKEVWHVGQVYLVIESSL
jgi:hypothetical protein